MVRVVHDGRRYRIEAHRGEAGFADILKWQMSSRRARWPKLVENTAHPPPPDAWRATTCLRHGSATRRAGADAGLNILTDPFLSARASPVPFAVPNACAHARSTRRTCRPSTSSLLSHNHYDHMDLPALRDIARHHAPHVVIPAAMQAG